MFTMFAAMFRIETNRRKLRISVEQSFKILISLILLCVALGYSIYPRCKDIWLAPIAIGIYFLICTVPLAFFKGFKYSLHDLDKGFPWAHYHFFAIFVATFLAPFFDATIYTMIGELKSG